MATEVACARGLLNEDSNDLNIWKKAESNEAFEYSNCPIDENGRKPPATIGFTSCFEIRNMNWNFDQLERAQRYKLLVGLVVPRPIALVTSQSETGVVNAAPFSFFNVLADEPPLVILSIEDRDTGPLKDSARNMMASGEFVVNLVDESIAARMHACAVDYPSDVSEIEIVGFTTAPSVFVTPPRIAEAPAALECTLHSKVEIGTRRILFGQVRRLHVREGLIDSANLRVDMEKYQPVGRLFANRYCKTGDQFALEKNAYLERMQGAGRV